MRTPERGGGARRRAGHRVTAAATVAAALLAGSLGLAACGSDDQEVPDGAVAIVGDAEISRDAFRERVDALSRAQPKSAVKAAGDQGVDPRAPLRQQALASLLAAAATEQEAADRGISVSEAEARERWRDAARDQFDNRRQLRRFLGGQTEQEVVDQLRLQLLTERINAQVAEEAGGGKAGQRAVQRFQREFAKRWQDETACGEDVEAAGCPGATATE